MQWIESILKQLDRSHGNDPPVPMGCHPPWEVSRHGRAMAAPWQAETSSQQMAALQRRHERMQRLEHDFAEERRMREANKGTMEMELLQHRRPGGAGEGMPVDGGQGRLMGWWGGEEVIDIMVRYGYKMLIDVISFEVMIHDGYSLCTRIAEANPCPTNIF